MKAEEVPSGKLFDSGQQLQVPLWQRRYTWDTQDWAELWKDLSHLRAAPSSTHFIGSFVLKALPWRGLPSEAKRYWIVDGQQRASTLTVLVIAIRDRLARLSANDEQRLTVHGDYTAQLLRNENLKEGHKDRLVPQSVDASRLAQLVEGTPAELSDSPIDRAYKYFADRMGELSAEELEELLSSLLVRVMAVWVVLEDNDNAHRVFQTLNAGGKPLRQSDLVRNYFFLLLNTSGDAFYNSHWRLLESDLTPRELEEFFTAWTITQGHTGGKASLFRYFQKDLASAEESPDEVLAYGMRLTAAARQFQWLRKPEDCPVAAARPLLVQLSLWGTLPAEGLLLLLLLKHSEGRLNEGALAEALALILSFVGRRLLAGFEPQLHKDIFVRLAHRLREEPALQHEDLTAYLRYLLSLGTDVRTWPGDDLIKARVTANALYTKSRSHWVLELLKRISESLTAAGHYPPSALDDRSIDHVMPEELTEDWAEALVEWGVQNPAAFHQSRLQVLGNLTLGAADSGAGPMSWPELKERLVATDLALNAELAILAKWTSEEIDARSLVLAEAACRAFRAPLSLAELFTSPFRDVRTTGELDEDEDIDDDV